jgi:hypothetical protein
MNYKFMPLAKIKEKEPEMRRLKVSEVARSPCGFLTAYKKAGTPDNLSKAWQNKRRGFIARTKPQYKENPTYRRRLALIAWAYDPDR